jgi:hypothetical protein
VAGRWRRRCFTSGTAGWGEVRRAGGNGGVAACVGFPERIGRGGLRGEVKVEVFFFEVRSRFFFRQGQGRGERAALDFVSGVAASPSRHESSPFGPSHRKHRN